MTIKELETKFHSELESLKKRSRTWLIVLGVAFILVLVLLFTVFKRKDNNSKIDALQQDLETEKARVEALESKLPLYDSLLANQQRQLDGNRQTETIIKHHYDKIYVDVPKLNNNQLRDEITNY